MDKKEELGQEKREIAKRKFDKREKSASANNKNKGARKKELSSGNKNIDVVKRFEYNRPSALDKESVTKIERNNKGNIEYSKSDNIKKAKDVKTKDIKGIEKEKRASSTKMDIDINKDKNTKTNNSFVLNRNKNSQNSENSPRSNVTDIKDIQRQALENEKRHRKEEKIGRIKQRIETLKTTKAKVYMLLAGLIIGFLIFISLTIVDNVIVDEGKHYSKDEVKCLMMKSVFDYNSVYLFLKNRYNEQEPIPFVEYVDVIWIDKNTIRLKVYDKNIIGCTNFMNEYVYFDKDGFVVETSSKKEDEIPYITGIDFEELTLNSKIKVSDEDIFELILNVTQQISKYELQIDEINFDKNYNLTLNSGKITILLGKQETYDEQLAKLKSMLEEAKKEKLSGVLHMEKYKEGQDRIIFDKNS